MLAKRMKKNIWNMHLWGLCRFIDFQCDCMFTSILGTVVLKDRLERKKFMVKVELGVEAGGQDDEQVPKHSGQVHTCSGTSYRCAAVVLVSQRIPVE